MRTQFSACVQAIASLQQNISTNSQLAAIREKYGHGRFQMVSRIPALPNLQAFLQ